MKTIPIASLKGGTGKSTTTVNIGRALVRRRCAIGLLDVDATAPTLHKALGLEETPTWQLDSARACIKPFSHEGLHALTLASFYGDHPAVMWDEATLINRMKELVSIVDWPALDYLLLDSPPSSSGFMQALYEFIRPQLHGTILVFQPTDIAVADLFRTIDFVHKQKIPLIGLVSNMSYCVSPSGEKFWPFLSPKEDIAEVCEEHGVPILGEVPLCPDRKVLDAVYDAIAAKIETVTPHLLHDDVVTRLYKKLKRAGIKNIVRRLA